MMIRFKSNEPMANGSTRQMIHPVRSKRALRNEMRCVLLGDEQFCFVFIFSLAKLSKTNNIVSKITQY